MRKNILAAVSCVLVLTTALWIPAFAEFDGGGRFDESDFGGVSRYDTWSLLSYEALSSLCLEINTDDSYLSVWQQIGLAEPLTATLTKVALASESVYMIRVYDSSASKVYTYCNRQGYPFYAEVDTSGDIVAEIAETVNYIADSLQGRQGRPLGNYLDDFQAFFDTLISRVGNIYQSVTSINTTVNSLMSGLIVDVPTDTNPGILGIYRKLKSIDEHLASSQPTSVDLGNIEGYLSTISAQMDVSTSGTVAKYVQLVSTSTSDIKTSVTSANTKLGNIYTKISNVYAVLYPATPSDKIPGLAGLYAKLVSIDECLENWSAGENITTSVDLSGLEAYLRTLPDIYDTLAPASVTDQNPGLYGIDQSINRCENMLGYILDSLQLHSLEPIGYGVTYILEGTDTIIQELQKLSDSMSKTTETTVNNIQNITITQDNDAYEIFYLTDDEGDSENVAVFAGRALTAGGKLLNFFFRICFDDAIENIDATIDDMSSFYFDDMETEMGDSLWD